MATLNTLRTRGGLIVSIVIAIALLAFLLGDLASSTDNMMNSRRMKVGEIDGHKIGYVEFSNQVDYYTGIEQSLTGKDALSSEEQDGVREMAWQNMIARYALEPGLEKLGVDVSESEQVDMVSGANISPVIAGMFVNPQTGMFDRNILSTFVSNIAKDPSGRSSMVWNYVKEQMNRQRIMSKYMILLSKGMFVTDLEVEREVMKANSLSDASYIMQEYTQVADSIIKVTDSEIRNFYKQHKNMFRQTASRDIEYVVFSVLASEEDIAAARRVIDEMAAEFATVAAPFQYAVRNSQVQPNKQFVSENQLTPELAAFAFGPNSGGMLGPVRIGDSFVLVRVAETKMIPDSIGARHILLPADQTAQADSIAGALRKGASFVQLSDNYSLDQMAASQGGDLGVFSQDRMIPEFWNAIVDAKKGEILTITTPYGIHVVEVTYRSPLTKKVQLAQITYAIEPSDATQQEIYAAASAFAGQAAKGYDSFNNAATEGGLSKRTAHILNTDRNVRGMDNSRELVRWAFTSEERTVSGIIEVNGDYVIASVTGVTESGIAPLEKVSSDIAAILRFEKKGQILSEKMSGSASLSDAASKLGVEILQAPGVSFNSFYIDGLGVEPKLIGAITALDVNILSRPVAGSAGVFLFEVTSKSTVDNTDAANERIRLEANVQSYIGERINQALIEVSDVKDLRVKFF